MPFCNREFAFLPHIRDALIMAKPHLYLLVGYPGSGKTTVAKIIHEKTGAEHLWTDWERRSMFESPTHSQNESDQLYAYLNNLTEQLLGEGKDVIFDTSFNFRKDRNHLREIAERQNAETTVIWVTTDKNISKRRALEGGNTRNGYDKPMTKKQFERIAQHLEPPAENEKVIKIDGTDVDSQELLGLLGL